MNCPSCGQAHALADNFCRNCGRDLSEADVPAIYEPGLPVPWDEVKASLMRGAALLVLGTGLELLRRGVSRELEPRRVADAVMWLLDRDDASEPEKEPALVPARREEPAPEGVVVDQRSYSFRRVFWRVRG